MSIANSSRRKPKRLKMKLFQHAIFNVLFLNLFLTANGASLQNDVQQRVHNQTYDNGSKDSRGIFSPRMDYDQWKPLGRGDPLQNDPTYDYVPPVLDRVHYWVEPNNRKQDGPQHPQHHDGKKSEILVLGVSSKRPSSSSSSAEGRRDSYESFLKFIDGPKFYHHHHHNSYIRPDPGQRPLHPPPHNFHSQYYKNKFDDGIYKPEEQRMPYTVLVPPPIPPPHMEMPLFKPQSPPPKPIQPTTRRPVYDPSATESPRPSISVQEANLIYHSSSSGESDRWQNGANHFGSSSQYVTWRAPSDPSPTRNTFRENETKGQPIVFVKNSSAIVKNEPIIRPVQAAIPTVETNHYNQPIVFPTESNTGRIVFEHHSTYDPSTDSSFLDSSVSQIASMIVQPSMPAATHIQQTPLVLASAVNPTLHVLRVTGTQPAVTHMAVGNRPMHKGQVSDDTVGNAYVNIGKPNAHIQKEVTTNASPVSNTYRIPTISNSVAALSVMKKPMMQMPTLPAAYSNNQINSVYTKVPTQNIIKPNIINNGKPFSRRPVPMTDDYTLQTMQTMQPPPPVTEMMGVVESATKKPAGFLQSILQNEYEYSTETTLPGYENSGPMTSTISTPTTTSVASLTTDPLFKHYKQPAEPLRGPMYLIIQGHSKVKTYGAGNKETLNVIAMPETNEIPQVGEKYPVKHLHGHKENYAREIKEDTSRARSKGARTLKDLVDTGFGNIDIQEAEIGAKYDVSSDEAATSSEKYYKGIVESEENDMLERHKLQSISKKREKRQLEEFIPVMEDTVETFVYDYLKRQSEGSGVGAILASVITNDSSEDYDDDGNEVNDDDEDEK